MDDDLMASPRTARAMAQAAARFLGALTDAQRNLASFGFSVGGSYDRLTGGLTGGLDERRDWSFLPVPERGGLPVGALDAGQRDLAHELIVSGTSMPGYAKVVSVMAMEHVLRALAKASRPAAARLFDPGRYCFRVFGEPGAAAWGWQVAGHHISLNYTVVDNRYVAPAPSLLGSEPARFGTLAPLADDEEAGFRLVNSLDARQRDAAIIWHRPPPDLTTRIVPRIGDVERPDPAFAPEPDYVISDEERDILSYVRSSPKGLPASDMSKQQAADLVALVEQFAGRIPADVAAAQMRDIERHGLDNLTFAWAGGTEPGGRHYFRVQGPVLLIEHDNTQAGGDHIHSVWRNPANDFGDDILARHYREHHAR